MVFLRFTLRQIAEMCCKQNNIETSKHHNMASSRDRDLMFFLFDSEFHWEYKNPKKELE